LPGVPFSFRPRAVDDQFRGKSSDVLSSLPPHVAEIDRNNLSFSPLFRTESPLRVKRRFPFLPSLPSSPPPFAGQFGGRLGKRLVLFSFSLFFFSTPGDEMKLNLFSQASRRDGRCGRRPRSLPPIMYPVKRRLPPSCKGWRRQKNLARFFFPHAEANDKFPPASLEVRVKRLLFLFSPSFSYFSREPYFSRPSSPPQMLIRFRRMYFAASLLFFFFPNYISGNTLLFPLPFFSMEEFSTTLPFFFFSH